MNGNHTDVTQYGPFHMAISISIEPVRHDDLHLHGPCMPSLRVTSPPRNFYKLLLLTARNEDYMGRMNHHKSTRRP